MEKLVYFYWDHTLEYEVSDLRNVFHLSTNIASSFPPQTFPACVLEKKIGLGFFSFQKHLKFYFIICSFYPHYHLHIIYTVTIYCLSTMYYIFHFTKY